MRTNIVLCWLAGVSLVLSAGCVSTIDGRQQAGFPFAPDTVEAPYKRPPQDLWVAAKDVLRYLGTITSEDTLRSVLQANVDTRRVWVKVEQVDANISRLVIQARTKGGNGDQALAGFIDKQIAVRLATGNLTPAAPGQRAY